MEKYILISFGFLGWAFYEMSGGSDFQPASVRMAQAEPAVASQMAPAEVASASKSATRQSDAVKKVALNLTTREVQAQPASLVQPAVMRESDSAATSSDAMPAWGAPTTQVILPSLIASNNTSAYMQNASATTAQGDVRTVAGDMVNVRGGPGTRHGVVMQLSRGEAVEILTENGNGWVRMRPLSGGEEGWMADFLLSNG